MTTTVRSQLLYWLILLGASANFVLAYGRLLFAPIDYRDFAHGLAPYPFQSRILMARVLALSEHSRALDYLSAHARGSLALPYRLLIVMIGFVMLVLAVEFVRLSLEFLMHDRKWAMWGSLVVIFMAYFHYILDADSPYMYPYDLPSVAVFSAGLYLILRRRWLWYYLLFILGTFNRETTCFLTLFFLIFEIFPIAPHKLQPVRTAVHALAQAAIWISIRDYCNRAYGTHHPGMYWALRDNLRHCFAPTHLLDLFTAFGFLWLVYLFGFRSIPYRGLRWCAWILVLWFGVMMTFGWIYEMRIYGELIPYMAICVVLIAHAFADRQLWEMPDSARAAP